MSAESAPEASPTYTGPERRDPRRANEQKNLELKEIASLVYARRFGGQRPANLNAEQFSSPKLKAAVRTLFDRVEGRLNYEQLNFREDLESQAGAAASVWTKRFPVQDGPSQSQLETSACAWLQGLSPQVLEGLRTLCPDTASLVVVPNLPVPVLLKLLKKGGKPSKIWWNYWKSVRTRGWKVGITNGAEDLPFVPIIYWKNKEQRKLRTNEAIVAEYKRRFETYDLTIMPPYGYVPSAARALAEGRVLDRQFFTAFEKPNGKASLLRGSWNHDRLSLGSNDSDGSYDNLRCRPWVEGELGF